MRIHTLQLFNITPSLFHVFARHADKPTLSTAFVYTHAHALHTHTHTAHTNDYASSPACVWRLIIVHIALHRANLPQPPPAEPRSHPPGLPFAAQHNTKKRVHVCAGEFVHTHTHGYRNLYKLVAL